MHNVILIQSKPGLGKSTLARSVVAALNRSGITADHLSMGDKLRGMLDGTIESRFTNELKKYQYELSHHLPIPDGELTADIVGEFCEQSAISGVQLSVIDGYPRYGILLPGFQRIIARHSLVILLVVILDGSDELATERIVGRNRQALGIAENAAERLRNYAEVSAPIVKQLSVDYPSIHIDAAKELPEKTEQVVVAVRQALIA